MRDGWFVWVVKVVVDGGERQKMTSTHKEWNERLSWGAVQILAPQQSAAVW